MVLVTFKFKLFLAYIISLLFYTLIYYYIGKKHFTNINNDWFIECMFFACNISSAAGSTTIVPVSTTIKLIISTHQTFRTVLLAMLIFN